MSEGRVSRWRLIAAFGAVWVIWGSTYLAIFWAIATVPPFFMAGTRFLIAGTILLLWSKWRGAPWPRRIEWRSGALVGGLLLLCGNGGVVWSEQRVPTGLAALLVATVPLWIVLLEALRPGGARPTVRTMLGVMTGLLGVALLVGRGEFVGGRGVDPVGAIVLVLASMSWATGSIYSRRAKLPSSPLMATGVEMLCGGGLLLFAGLLHGEVALLHVEAISMRSILALLYLIAFGSLIGFTAYIWLLRTTTPGLATTYAYVNPVVAVLLGWAFAGESITPRTVLAMAVIVTGVVIITTQRSRQSARTLPASPADPPVEVPGPQTLLPATEYEPELAAKG